MVFPARCIASPQLFLLKVHKTQVCEQVRTNLRSNGLLAGNPNFIQKSPIWGMRNDHRRLMLCPLTQARCEVT
jgi:hypothetical protein